jgi:multiple sugar transport system substrate-binding protein
MRERIPGIWRTFAIGTAAIIVAGACASAAPTAAPTAAAVVQPTPQVITITAPPVVQPTPQVITITPAPTAVAPVTPAPTPLITAQPTQAGGLTSDGKILIRWFVGLGTGGNPEQLAAEQKAVAAFNAADGPGGKAGVVLSLEVYQNAVAYDTLATQIATHNGPDIIGPIGVRALNGFGDQLLDLKPYLAKGTLDTTGVEQNLIDLYNVNGKQIGVPYAVYPSYIYYNKAAFKEAKLAEPPHKVGDKYTLPDGTAVDWNWDTVSKIAKILTVDEAGNDATSAAFDPTKIQQYGFDFQWTDPRGWASVIGGSGSVVGADGKAQLPDNWKAALEWYYANVWTSHISPNQDAITGMAGGNPFQSGRVAIGFSHSWYTCCIYPGDGTTPVKDWDIAVAPISLDGKVTAKLHSDTMGIMATSLHADAAVDAMNFIMSQPDIAVTYGALPAKAADRTAFFTALDTKFANAATGKDPTKVDWTVASDMLGYTEFPNHEADMPNFLKSDAAIKALQSDMLTNGKLDIAARLAELVATLQADFDAAGQ